MAVVTGASDGIETAKALASMGTRTILACRNEAKTRQVRAANDYRTLFMSRMSVHRSSVILKLFKTCPGYGAHAGGAGQS